MSEVKPGRFMKMQSLVQRTKTFLNSTGSSGNSAISNGFITAKTEASLFPVTLSEIDGEECLHDCSTCTVHLPRKWSINEDDKLYGHVNRWDTHLIVGTGKNDWVRDITDEKGSVMQAVGKVGLEQKNGKVMLSACNMPTGEDLSGHEEDESTCLLLPAWTLIEKVKPQAVPQLMRDIVAQSVTNTSPLHSFVESRNGDLPQLEDDSQRLGKLYSNGISEHAIDDAENLNRSHSKETNGLEGHASSLPPIIATRFKTRACPHRALILLCSHKTRDARCGQSAPLLRKEFERHLRPLGLYRDLQDERPGGVGIYFINHVGGHKYSANCLIYRREGRKREGTDEDMDGAPLHSEAVQCIWLARLRPEDCENVVRYTVLQGKLVKPKHQLRGGFDREQGVTSW